MATVVYQWCLTYLLLLFSLCCCSQFTSDKPHCVLMELSLQSGKRLLGYNFINKTKAKGDGLSCTDHCALNCLCVSINTKALDDGDELCELNYESELTVTTALEDDNEYDYIELGTKIDTSSKV